MASNPDNTGPVHPQVKTDPDDQNHDIEQAAEPVTAEAHDSTGVASNDVERAVNSFQLRLLHAGGDRVVVTVWPKNSSDEVMEDAGTIVDELKPTSSTARKRVLKALSDKFPSASDTAIDFVDQMIKDNGPKVISKGKEKPRPRPAEENEPSARSDEILTTNTDSDLRNRALLTLRADDLLGAIDEAIESVGVVGEQRLARTIYLLGTSRLLRKPVSGIVQGSSSSGKSFTIESVAKLFPCEQIIRATDLTANALYYVPKGDLMHRWVVAGERSRVEDDGRAEATRALREMVASGTLRKALPMKDDDGNFVTRIIESPGPIAFTESTTLADVFEEDANRMLLLASDDSEEQTRRVVSAIANAHVGDLHDAEEARRTVELHQTMQRMLRRVTVRIPYARSLALRVPPGRTEARRLISQVLGLIQSIALLHQFSRLDSEPKHGDVVEATVGDYAIARELLIEPVGRSLGNTLAPHVAKFVAWIEANYDMGNMFTVAELTPRYEHAARSSIYNYLKAAVSVGVVQEAGREGGTQLYKRGDPMQETGASWLPVASELRASAT